MPGSAYKSTFNQSLLNQLFQLVFSDGFQFLLMLKVHQFQPEKTWSKDLFQQPTHF